MKREGIISKKHKTGIKEEAMSVLPEIKKLASDVLTEDELTEADETSEMLIRSEKERKLAVEKLKTLVGKVPKRPLYYLNMELDFLPHWTRDSVKYSGDYLDILVKHLVFYTTNDHKDRNLPMGPALQKVKKYGHNIDDQLISDLIEYNSISYVPAKHNFSLPEGRKDHRFSSKEVVLTVFVAMKLGKAIMDITRCEPQLNCHGL